VRIKYLLYLGASFFILLMASSWSAAAWYDSGWNYRKSHVINKATGAGTNYQVKITVHYSGTADSGGDVYCNSHSKTDFGDIRFTGSDGTTLLDYWMESKTDSNNAVFWVEVKDSLESNNQTIYIYYGNSGVSTTSSGDNTFLFFDDFGSLDWNKWEYWPNVNETGTATAEVHNSRTCVKVSGTTNSCTKGGYIRTKVFSLGPSDTARLEMRYLDYTASNGGPWSGFCRDNAVKDGGCDGNYYFPYPTSVSSGWTDAYYKSVSGTWYGGALSGGNTNAISCWKRGDGQFTWISAGGSSADRDALSGTYKILIGGYGGFSSYFNTWIDCIFVRKYVASEPAHSTWGSEESPPHSSYKTKVGNARDWAWKIVYSTDAVNTVPSGTPIDWTWRTWEPGSGRKVPQGTAADWTWGAE